MPMSHKKDARSFVLIGFTQNAKLSSLLVHCFLEQWRIAGHRQTVLYGKLHWSQKSEMIPAFLSLGQKQNTFCNSFSYFILYCSASQDSRVTVTSCFVYKVIRDSNRYFTCVFILSCG